LSRSGDSLWIRPLRWSREQTLTDFALIREVERENFKQGDV